MPLLEGFFVVLVSLESYFFGMECNITELYRNLYLNVLEPGALCYYRACHSLHPQRDGGFTILLLTLEASLWNAR